MQKENNILPWESLFFCNNWSAFWIFFSSSTTINLLCTLNTLQFILVKCLSFVFFRLKISLLGCFICVCIFIYRIILVFYFSEFSDCFIFQQFVVCDHEVIFSLFSLHSFFHYVFIVASCWILNTLLFWFSNIFNICFYNAMICCVKWHHS